MLNRSKAWALALLATVFVAGAAVGWFGHDWTDRGPRSGGHGRNRMVDRLTSELRLTPTQRDSVRVICDRQREEIAALWKEMHPRYDSVRARFSREIDAQLTPEQQARHQRFNAERQHRHRRADSTSGK